MNAPFSIGQKVVCIDDNFVFDTLPKPPIKKGNVYTVCGVAKSCCHWMIDLGVYSGLKKIRCSKCSKDRVKPNTNFWAGSFRFAPIQTNYADATAEILEKFKPTEDTPDKILIPEKLKSIP